MIVTHLTMLIVTHLLLASALSYSLVLIGTFGGGKTEVMGPWAYVISNPNHKIHSCLWMIARLLLLASRRKLLGHFSQRNL